MVLCTKAAIYLCTHHVDNIYSAFMSFCIALNYPTQGTINHWYCIAKCYAKWETFYTNAKMYSIS